MYKKKLRLVPFVLIVLLILSHSVVFAEGFAIEILGGEKEVKLGIEDLKSMADEAKIDEEYIYNSKSGEKSTRVKGVSLAYILKDLANVSAENADVSFQASDGYPVAPQYLEDILSDGLKYVVAYEVDGEAIISKDTGNEEVSIYRKLRHDGEFDSVYKYINKVTVGEALEATGGQEPFAAVIPKPHSHALEATGGQEPKEEPVEEVGEKIEFTDITEEYAFAKEAIEGLAGKGIIAGMGDGKYEPAGDFTRAQFAKIMVEALGYGQVEYKGSFSDVKSDDWFAPYVESAVANGLFKGRSEDVFDPDSKITRQELATVVGRGAVIAGVVEEAKIAKFTMSKSDFADKDLVEDWAAREVAWLEAQKVFTDIAKESFEPTRLVNRAEAALVVYKALFSN